ncbi:hypothetical protein PTKIN_Ptkin07bG0294600 [Pterospermum kingtungense]
MGLNKNDKDLAFRLDKGNGYDSDTVEKLHFELSFKKKDGDIVLNSYLPLVLKTAESIESETRVLKMHTMGNPHLQRVQLENIQTDSELRKMVLNIANKSILVFEDIDCTANLPDGQQMTLSGLLNFIDGLWSSCGDERIIVLTTNRKHKLDPALLRPGRMDMHINMSYCTAQAFRVLASNYLGIKGEHRLFGELLEPSKVTPAQVAEELMKNEDPDTAL